MKKRQDILKIFLLLVFFFSLSGPSGAETNPFRNYRYNPFQFPYEQYYFQAETIKTNQQVRPPDKWEKIQFFEFTARIPETCELIEHKTEDSIIVKLQDNQGLLIKREKEELMGCSSKKTRENNKDFCSAFASTQDFYQKLFTLTPVDLEEPEFSGKGYSWIVHRKGMMFNRVSKIYIYKGRQYTAYRSDFSDPHMSTKTELIIFPEKIEPDYVTVSMNFLSEHFINAFLSSFAVSSNK